MRTFISQRVQSVPPSGIRRFFDIAATMKDVISLGIGEPDFVTPEPILKAGMVSLERGETHYTPNFGLLELRRAVASNLKRLYGVTYDPEQEVLITVGVSEAVYLAFTALLDPGDEVIVPQPCFVAFTPDVIFAGGVPVVIGTKAENEFQVTAEAIERAITPKAKILFLSHPNNPTGAVLSRENLMQIAQVVRRHDLLVVSDEIYDRLVYNGQHICVASLPGMHERTITLGGFSKTYAMTGWRLGYAAAPVEILRAMYKIHQYTIMSAPTTAQIAGIVAINNGDHYVAEMVAEYDRRRRLLMGGLNQLGLDCIEPKGAFYAFPSVAKTGMDDETFAEELLREEQVAVVPGFVFGESGRGFVRMSYATAYEKLVEALRRISRFMRRHG